MSPRSHIGRRDSGKARIAGIRAALSRRSARPTLFDAIEFDEGIATVDTLYDLAFLLMDLEARGQRVAANVALNRYLWRSRRMLDLEGMAALPLFLALRAGIRAMVLAQRAAQRSSSGDAYSGP